MGDHVQLNVPPEAETARLLTRAGRWGVYYRSVLGDSEGRLEFRQIDSDLLRADLVDPADTDAVVTHVERRLRAAGYVTERRAADDDHVAATWDISHPGAA